MANLIQKINQNNDKEFFIELEQFSTLNKNSLHFKDIKLHDKKRLFDSLIEKALSSSPSSTFLCLEAVKILSRDKTDLDHCLSSSVIRSLINLSRLSDIPLNSQDNLEVVVEALKCLCNLVYNSPSLVLNTIKSCKMTNALVDRMKIYKDSFMSYDIKLFDMKLLHLITALDNEIRTSLRNEMHGLVYLTEILDLILKKSEGECISTGCKKLTDDEVNLSIEVLKTLFNISNISSQCSEEEEMQFERLACILHDLLTSSTDCKEKLHLLRCHIANLLIFMPESSYQQLLSSAAVSTVNEITSQLNAQETYAYDEFMGYNMASVLALLSYVKKQLDSKPSHQLTKEDLLPILNCLCRLCRCNRLIRKFCRLQVLSYLGKEVKELPEQGDTLRNKLCKLFTHNNVQLKTLSAEFLFILCKQNTRRLIKYTGYGNSAALLAEKGLMNDIRDKDAYSSESDNSETEEYSELKNDVNPVTGRWEEKSNTSNELDNMTNEQKEYLAQELIDKMDKLQKIGVIKPMRTCEKTGKPKEIESMAEMVEKTKVESEPEDEDI